MKLRLNAPNTQKWAVFNPNEEGTETARISTEQIDWHEFNPNEEGTETLRFDSI